MTEAKPADAKAMADRHTPEPWEVKQNDQQGVWIDSPRGPVARMIGRDWDDLFALADAERIVACVNALAGYDPSAVGELVEAAKRAEDQMTMTDVDRLDTVSQTTKRLRRALTKLEGKT